MKAERTPLMPVVPGRAVDLDEARRLALDHVRPLVPAEMPVGESAGLILAKEIRATAPLPRFDNSAMDGYAIRNEDVTDGNLIHRRLATPVSTGMPIPPGADTVVPYERVRSQGAQLLIENPVRVGDNVRRAGEEVRSGDVVLAAGNRVTPAAVGLLSALGRQVIPVFPRPTVGILVSGDELAPVGQDLEAGRIYDANGPMLEALVSAAGARVGRRMRVGDDPDTIHQALICLLAEADLVCTSGGTSVGKRDLLTDVVSTLGRVLVRQINVKPGRPTSFAAADQKPIVLLPGNPLALLAGFEAICRPCLRRLAGDPRPYRRHLYAQVTKPIRHRHGRDELVPVRLTFEADRIRAVAARHRGSAMLRGAASANGMGLIEAERGDVLSGERLVVEQWPEVE